MNNWLNDFIDRHLWVLTVGLVVMFIVACILG